MHIALFGTSADPPTIGHYQILTWLTQHYDWVAAWASDNPFKRHPVSLEHRHAMLDRVVAAVQAQHPNICLAPELSAPRTFHTLERAQAQWPEARFTLVVGSDLLAQLPRWYQAERLLQQVTLLVIPRPGAPLQDGAFTDLQQMGAQVAIAPLMGLAVSSSAYRDRGEAHALLPTVQDYIHQQRLYSWPDAAPAPPPQAILQTTPQTIL